ncbi:MAG: HAD family phosphatase [bacterium]|nr:HAD family phosphatase [bacterium]
MTQRDIRAVIFDYGNVLVRTLDPAPRATWEQRFGLQAGDLQRIVHNKTSWIAAQLGQISPATYWHEIGDTLKLTAAETSNLRATFYRGDLLNVELVAYLDRLRAAGLQVALLSNFSTDLHGFLSTHALQHRFDPIAVSADIGVMKPDAQAYQTVLDRLALPANACVFVDDLAANVQAAQTLGMHGIVFRDNATCLDALEALLAVQPDDART